jgi:predicted NBD/HSP70 family sugar kinase
MFESVIALRLQEHRSSNSTKIAAPFLLSPPEAQALTSIRRLGPLSRTEIAEAIGYSRSKITSVINGLTLAHILEEIGDGTSSGGRRPRVLDFNADFGYVVGVDLGATSVDLAIADFGAHILHRESLDTDVRDGPDATLGLIIHQILGKLDQLGISPNNVYAFGIGVPGPVEFSTGLLIAPPIMPGWEAYPIRSFIKESFPATVCVVDNDVNVMAMGELRAGAGIVTSGEIYRGSNGSAGDIGHICADPAGPVCHCGNIGCLEAIAAGPPIAAKGMEAARRGDSPILAKYLKANSGTLTAEDIGLAAAEGDPIANELIQESGRIIGEVLASLVNFYNPSLILIGGGVSKIGHQFLASIRRGVLHRSLPLSTRHLRIDTSLMGSDAGITGAITLALEHVFVVKE